MYKSMRKAAIAILIFLCALFCALSFAACEPVGGGSGGGSGGLGNNNVAIEKQYNENIKYKLSYTSDEECPNGNIDDNYLHESIDFETGKVYYMVVDFTISSFEMSGWGNNFNTSVKLFPSSAVDATLEEAATGNFTEKEEDGGINITTTYSIPENRIGERSYRIAVQFRLKRDDLVNIGLIFCGDNENISKAYLADSYISINVTMGLIYTLNDDGTSYSVSQIGTATEKNIILSYSYWGFPVTSIGGFAFSGCSNIKSITIPDSVTTIGRSAFSGCTSLISVTIGNRVTSIGDSAFENCTSLTAVYITDIASWCNIAFGGWDATPLYYAHNLYLNNQLVTTLEIPYGVTSIGKYAFENCTSLTSVIIGDNVTLIGYEAFYNCTSLTSIKIPDSVTSIGYGAFWCCTSLESVTIGNGVTSIGSYAFYNCTSLTAVYITDIARWCSIEFFDSTSNPLLYAHNLYLNNELVTMLKIPYGVTSIGAYAFEYCTSLTSIEISDDVTYIGAYAFEYCTSLKNIEIPDGVTSISDYVFRYCKSLKSITIPDSVTSIGAYAFNGCTSLETITVSERNSEYSSQDGILYNKTKTTFIHIPKAIKGSIIIPSGITYIGNWAFENCTSLTSIIIPDSVTSIYGSAFRYCESLKSITIPDSVTSIGEYVFSGCTSLESITIPDSVTSIGSDAFANCTSLTAVYITDIARWCSIEFDHWGNPLYYAHNLYLNNQLVTELEIPDSVTLIGDYAFNGCTSLISVTIGNSVTSIGLNAFNRCTSLKSITIPNSVTTIYAGAFYNCTSLESITIPDSVTSIGSDAFYNCTSLTSVIIGDNVTLIGYEAFYNCTSLTSVTIGNSVTSIRGYAFSGCSSLTSIIIPNRVTSIDSYAFSGCTGLKSITIPDGVTSIGNYAFYNCTSLKSVVFKNMVGWQVYLSSAWPYYNINSSDLSDPATAAKLLTNTYRSYYWQRS